MIPTSMRAYSTATLLAVTNSKSYVKVVLLHGFKLSRTPHSNIKLFLHTQLTG